MVHGKSGRKKLENSIERPTVIVVDDAEENLMIIESILANEYNLKLFSESQQALDFALSSPPDLILLDIMMPNIDGYEICRQLKSNPKLVDIPVIFITSKSDYEDEERGFSVGASDFINKPIYAPILLARVKTHLKIKLALDYLKNENTRLESGVKRSSSELIKIIKTLCDNPFFKV
jgi:putative two-component system response regulator